MHLCLYTIELVLFIENWLKKEKVWIVHSPVKMLAKTIIKIMKQLISCSILDNTCLRCIHTIIFPFIRHYAFGGRGRSVGTGVYIEVNWSCGANLPKSACESRTNPCALTHTHTRTTVCEGSEGYCAGFVAPFFSCVRFQSWE